MAQFQNSIIEGTYKTLLQGVSQQTPRQRIEGQVSKQVNMYSDLVQGMQRRAGLRVLRESITGIIGAESTSKLYSAYHSTGDDGRSMLIDPSTGVLYIADADFNDITIVQDDFLIASSPNSFQSVALRGRVYICNKEQTPALVVTNTDKQDPDITGFFYIKSGAFSKTYEVTIATSGGTYSVSYTTPDGSVSGDAALSTPSAIATQLCTVINAHTPSPMVVVQQSEAFVFVKCSTGYSGLNVSTSSGTAYAGSSNRSLVSTTSELPARLPSDGDNCMVAVGTTERTQVWYSYDYENSLWIENSAYDSPSSITNLLYSFDLVAGADTRLEVCEGRLSGSDVTNEDPAFIENGISGITAYQGRLVVLAGAEVVMSAAGKPLRFYRSTVTSLLDEDPIGIVSGSASAADFQYGIQFNKDLILFSSACQAVVPGTNVAISPNNAQIVLTSSYRCDTNSPPIDTGRSVLFPVPITESHDGMYELLPSSYTASQYMAYNITEHLPTYFKGRAVKCVNNIGSNMLVFQTDADPYSVYVYQYFWGADSKLQNAWHTWTFEYPIVAMWFSKYNLALAFHIGDGITIATVDTNTADTITFPAQENTPEVTYIRPYIDMYSLVTVTNGEFQIPASVYSLTTNAESIRLVYASGSLAGDRAGIESVTPVGAGYTGSVVRNVEDGKYWVGVPYTSIFIPTPPILKDSKEAVFGDDSMLMRYVINTSNTAEFNAQVNNAAGELLDIETSPVSNAAYELNFDAPVIGTLKGVVVPVRAKSKESSLTLTCSSTHQMRILSIDYVLKYVQRRRRM